MKIITAILMLSLTAACTKKSNTENRTPASSAQVQQDTTIVGYNVALNQAEFIAAYGTKIKCEEITSAYYGLTVNWVDCKFIDPELNANVAFFQGKLWYFLHNATGKNIRMRLATEAIEKKAGATARIFTASGGVYKFCASATPFGNGVVQLQSEDIYSDCDSELFSRVNWHYVKYGDRIVNQLFEDAKAALKDKAERQAAGEIKL